ncbi:uncharacterized protein BCR38DRAFT_430619 [Pseudomassariella vexata]|uniref:Peptidase M20 dimerisation domain-containing protein n=1 Tax=Pseudomassariella vexata TaxID=1141098 RepID=A0A1Y2E4R6_9PEZI|nr:uncharacterized protein BCR38DRAFT_430619 [Pseudomassariella vexata]ORY66550.1 hypothetical protein BCR38DRAFT_430619 [Pseudomassariella vexata]
MKLLLAALIAGSSVFASSSQRPLTLDTDLSFQSTIGEVYNSGSAPSYRASLVALHKALVSIPSVTGNENEVGTYLVDYLTERGLHAQLQFIPPSNTTSDASTDEKPRFNVLAWPGKTRNPSPKVLVSSHIDTVPPFIPYSASDDPPNADTVIAGRGSVDAKASVAAQVTALLDLLLDKSVSDDVKDVMLLYVVGEETNGAGMRYFSETWGLLEPPPTFKAGIFGEPTEGKLACGHKGHLACTIKATGRAGHSGYPWLGKSATEVLMRALIKVLDTDLGSSERFGNTTVNVGRIEGGVASNVIAEKAEARLTIRVAIAPQDKGANVIEERISDVLKSVDEDLEMDCGNGYGAVICDCEVDGFKNITVNYGTDVPNLKGDHTRYLYGPGTIFVAHGPDEALKLSDLEAAVEGYKKLILHALQS